MSSRKVLLCGQHDALLQTLRNMAGRVFDVEQMPAEAPAPGVAAASGVGLVVMLHLPPQHDALPHLRDWKRSNPQTPVVVATADFSGSTIRLLLKSGAEDVIELPAEPEQVLACLEAYYPGFKLAGNQSAKTSKSSAVGGLLMAAVTPGLLLAGAEGLQTAAPFMRSPAQPEIQMENTEHLLDGVRITFFGAFGVHIKGRKLELPKQAKLLLAYLGCMPPFACSRERLARAFWPEKYENAPESARRSLNVEITRIRNLCRSMAGDRHEYIIFKNNCYLLEQSLSWHSDLEQFKYLCSRIQDCQRQGQAAPVELFQDIIATYQGNFLEDFQADYLNWIEPERQRFGTDFERVADLYSAQLCEQGHFWKAVSVCNDIIARDDRMEVIHRRLMECHAQIGALPKVEAQYRLCCQMMEREFQCKPSPETTRLYEDIRRRLR